MDCPNCIIQLEKEQYEGVTVDRCPKCRGVWLDEGEIAAVVEKRDRIFTPEEKIAAFKSRGKDLSKSAKLPCPKCNEEMKVIQYAVTSGVFIHRCPANHGIWLDDRELDNLQIVMEEYDKKYDRIRGPDEPEKADIKECPKCNVPMHEIKREDVIVDECRKCGGVWCDTDELNSLIKNKNERIKKELEEAGSEEEKKNILEREKYEPRIVHDEDLVSMLNCIVCGAPMKRINYQYSSGIIIDVCPHNHGIWLDKGELERVFEFTKRWGGVEKRIRNYESVFKKHHDDTISPRFLKVSRFFPLQRLAFKLKSGYYRK